MSKNLEKLCDDLFLHFRQEPTPYMMAFDATIGGYTSEQGDMSLVSELEGLFDRVRVYRAWERETGRDEPDLIHRIAPTDRPDVWQLTDETGKLWKFDLRARRRIA